MIYVEQGYSDTRRTGFSVRVKLYVTKLISC